MATFSEGTLLKTEISIRRAGAFHGTVWVLHKRVWRNQKLRVEILSPLNEANPLPFLLPAPATGGCRPDRDHE